MNLTKELNESICPIAEDCLFYIRDDLRSPEEKSFYEMYCKRNGENCGLKRHYDISERLKNTKDFPRDKKNWRSK